MHLKCVVCKTKLEGEDRKRKFCSKQCRNRFYNFKNKAKQAEWARKNRGKYAEGKIQCKICGQWYFQICSHVVQIHKMNNREYKTLIGRDVKRGLIPIELAKVRYDRNLENKDVVWENLKKGKASRFKKGVSNNYTRSPETMERLSEFGKKNGGYNKK